MSKKVQEAIKKEVVDPALKESSFILMGRVLETYYIDNPLDEHDFPELTKEQLQKKAESLNVDSLNRNAADVKITHPSTGKEEVLKKVPLMTGPMMGGVDGRRIQVGDSVVVVFLNGSRSYPRIIAKQYDDYKDNNAEKKVPPGSRHPDYYDSIL